MKAACGRPLSFFRYPAPPFWPACDLWSSSWRFLIGVRQREDLQRQKNEASGHFDFGYRLGPFVQSFQLRAVGAETSNGAGRVKSDDGGREARTAVNGCGGGNDGEGGSGASCDRGGRRGNANANR